MRWIYVLTRLISRRLILGTNEHMAHLAPRAKKILELPKAERAAFVQKDIWIPYPTARQLDAEFRAMIERPKVGRAQCRVIVGPSNNGKSQVAKQFCKKNPATHDDETCVSRVPALYIPGISKPDDRLLFCEILRQMGMPYSPKESPAILKYKVYGALEDLNVGLIFIDEFNTIAAGTPARQRDYLSELRSMVVATCIPVVCIGTREAIRVMQYDPAFQNRFKPRPLDAWEYGKDWNTMLKAFEGTLPLPEPSNLFAPKFGKQLHHRTEGLLGELRELITDLATHAIQNDLSKIKENLIEEVGYVSPSDRNQAADYN